MKATRKNGITSGRIQFARDWSETQTTGRIPGRSSQSTGRNCSRRPAGDVRLKTPSHCASHREAATGVDLITWNLFSLSRFTRAPQGATRLCAGVLAVFENLYAVYEYVFYANSVLVRFFECRAIRNGCRIKDQHVGKHSLLEKPAMIEAEIRGRQSAQAMDRVAHGKNFFVAHIFAEHTCEISVSARVRIRFQEDSFRRL